MALRAISLFSGVGGLDLSFRIASQESRVVCYVEGEAYAASVLVARMEEGSLDKAPIWSDARTFDGFPWRGRVDIVFGGFPCQDLSLAGRGAGIYGERSGLWWDYVRIIREVRPKYVFVENVPPIVKRGLRHVLGSLAEIGYDAEWGCLSADSIGAPHIRERFFLFAKKTEEGHVKREVADRGCFHRKGEETGSHTGDSTGVRSSVPFAGASRDRVSSGVGDSHHAGLSESARERVGTAQELKTLERAGRGIFPHGPQEIESWRNTEYVSQPCVYGVDDGLANRVDRVRACGNGVVAIQGAAALVLLSRRAGVEL